MDDGGVLPGSRDDEGIQRDGGRASGGLRRARGSRGVVPGLPGDVADIDGVIDIIPRQETDLKLL